MFNNIVYMLQINNKKRQQPLNKHLTCAIYNHDGTKILGTYNDEDIYLIDTKKDEYIEGRLVIYYDGIYLHFYTNTNCCPTLCPRNVKKKK